MRMTSWLIDVARRRLASSSIAAVLVLCGMYVGAQQISFESVDADVNGRLTRIEFGNLPGFYGAPDLFAELDLDTDRLVSREEWAKGFPDGNGNRGSAKEAIASGARRGVPPEFEAHGPSVPRENNEEVSLENLAPKSQPALTGHGGANATKRGVMRTPPPPSPDEPPRLEVAPRTRR